jgi:tetratricopeptide (TPR) repeat protein
MKRFLIIVLLLIPFALVGCSASFTAYTDNMFKGKELLQRGNYAGARDDFVKAAQAQPDGWSYAYAATASYKLNDLKSAEHYINQAASLDGRSFAYLRIAGYKALILLAEGRQQEGLDALGNYLTVYGNYYPLQTIEKVRDMRNSGKVHMPILELLLDEQIVTYENDIWDFYNTGTGWYGQRYHRSLSVP